MINAIAAIGQKNRVLGNKGQIPWYIPEDFAHFKKTTMNHPIIMGRKTFETFKNPLPGRTHILITRDPDYKTPEGVLLASNIEDAIELAKQQPGAEEIFIIGGGQIYEQAQPFVERLYLTLVEGDFEGDVFFPSYNEFTKLVSEIKSKDENFKFKFLVLEK